MLWVEVFLNLPLNNSFFYRWEQGNASDTVPKTGLRAQVNFGKRKMTAFIVKTYKTVPEKVDFPLEKIKPLTRIIDTLPLFTEEQIQLALWMEEYYLCSRGEALSAMLPSGKKESGTPAFPSGAEAEEFEKKTLSAEQRNAVDEILGSDETLHYLYGTTGSGKTEVFLQIAEQKLAEGKGVIYLVPEIGLTTQVRQAVISRFGETAAVLHSALTGSQRLLQWRRIIQKKARVVIGARSAVFAPVPDLGLIIIDEEHDGSYKSSNSPRYSARQIAIKRCTECRIPLVMGSATPSVEAWYMIKQRKIQEHRLSKRLAGGKEPTVELIRLANAGSESGHTESGRMENGIKKSPASGCISLYLEENIRQTLKNGRQVILFLNRRGFTHFFRCKSCGFDLMCKNCSVSLTYHKKERILRCHYCGWSIKPPQECPECASLDIEYAGFGTEFIEEEIRIKFPEARIVRADSDSLKHRGELEEKLTLFKEKKADILLGTQMVAKGLNFPGVQLVGVVMADTGLHLPDFRAAERTFSLIVQVAGRAGRFFPDGKVIVQTYNPDKTAIALACSGNIDEFYAQELQVRKELFFPPFSRLIRLVFRSADPRKAYNAAEDAARIINDALTSEHVQLLGPAECPLEKIAANYRYQLLLRGKRLVYIQHIVRFFLSSYKPAAGLYIEVDVDPISLL
ncbi:primosomal protein N' [Treponema sp. OMZ 840]